MEILPHLLPSHSVQPLPQPAWTDHRGYDLTSPQWLGHQKAHHKKKTEKYNMLRGITYKYHRDSKEPIKRIIKLKQSKIRRPLKLDAQ